MWMRSPPAVKSHRYSRLLASALKKHEDGAVRLDDVEVDFDVQFPETEAGTAGR